MAMELEKLNHRRDQLVQGHAERKQKRADDLQAVKAQAANMVQEATDRAELDQVKEDSGHAFLLADLDKKIEHTVAATRERGDSLPLGQTT